MNVERWPEGLLSAQSTLALLGLIEGVEGSPESSLIHRFAAFARSSRERAAKSIEALCRLGVVERQQDRLRLTDAWRGGASLWMTRLGEAVAEVVSNALACSTVSCLRAGPGGQGLTLDSRLLPDDVSGLGLWVVEFGIAHRTACADRLWRLSSEHSALFLRSARICNERAISSSLSAARLKERLDNDAQSGLLAEEWVLAFEKERLKNHLLVDQIARISSESVDAGYDIVSFSSEAALTHDLFIEVKSYARDKRFFWTRNEIKTAEVLGERYSLYLVDRARMNVNGYVPQVIPGPYAALFSSHAPAWHSSPTVYEFTELADDEAEPP